MPPRPNASLRPLATALLALAALGIGAAPAGAAAPVAEAPAAVAARNPATVTVTGTGSASAAPDLAVLTLGVEVTAPTAKKALAGQNAAAQALLTAVRKQGVAERDARTEGLSLSGVYKDVDGASKLTGYRASQSFSVTVRKLATTGRVLQAAMDAAGDAGRVHGVAFDVADKQELRAEARAAAHDDARAKAEQYARLSGRPLGRLVSLSENDGGGPRPLAVPVEAVTKDQGVPVAPGEIEDQVTLVAVYELD
ncbi:SIMPL domain-containing protein [Streptomyces sp. NPDC053474]|uniref:SIMPL domain-containing protein n=1 Tax=Streptomyces sp. NPDC053474 TaxID=3365704 RepID=UPI0037D54B3A